MCLYVNLEGDCFKEYHFGNKDQDLARTEFRVLVAYTEVCLTREGSS